MHTVSPGHAYVSSSPNSRTMPARRAALGPASPDLIRRATLSFTEAKPVSIGFDPVREVDFSRPAALYWGSPRWSGSRPGAPSGGSA
ncbi:hypothetical protein [Streptomyces lacrimifluminis]|uniref:hypothetical protein n=1 Tax=Streptomyces lacrimifluminis TaxID=1500077 RepID=UPI00166C38FC